MGEFAIQCGPDWEFSMAARDTAAMPHDAGGCSQRVTTGQPEPKPGSGSRRDVRKFSRRPMFLLSRKVYFQHC
mgnify:CR=1 FL=1